MTPEEYAKKLGIDLEVEYKDFSDKEALLTLQKALKKIGDRRDTVENLEKVKEVIYILFKVLQVIAAA